MVDYSDLLLRLAPDDVRLRDETVSPEPTHGRPRDPTTIAGKIFIQARNFKGKPLIWLYHAALIVHLRRGVDTEWAWGLFDRLWRQNDDWMLARLDSRWLVSAIDTVADHHPDAATRAAAVAVSTVATTMRMGETERRARGPDLRPLGHDPRPHRLHDGLRWFAIGSDDTMVHLLERLRRVEDDGTLPGRVLSELLRRAQIADTVFRRFADAHDDEATRWALPSPARLSVALFNDTSARRHYGCTAVMNSIDQLFGDAGIAIGWRHSVLANALDDPGTQAAIETADAIVVNGEGTIHSSRRKARALAALAPLARAAGKPAWLLNATLQGNDDEIVDDLAAFNHIWVREGASAAWARARGLAVTVAPDLSFCQKLEPLGTTTGRRSGPLVIDSVLPEVNLTLQKIADRFGKRLWTMEYDETSRRLSLHQERAQRRTRGAPKDPRQIGDTTFRTTPRGGPCSLPEFVDVLAQHQALVTGRFHAVCLAMLLRLPFCAFPSNTWKIEGMLTDAGLDPARLVQAGADAPDVLPFSDDELAAIDRYVRRARLEAGEMVLRILSAR